MPGKVVPHRHFNRQTVSYSSKLTLLFEIQKKNMSAMKAYWRVVGLPVALGPCNFNSLRMAQAHFRLGWLPVTYRCRWRLYSKMPFGRVTAGQSIWSKTIGQDVLTTLHHLSSLRAVLFSHHFSPIMKRSPCRSRRKLSVLLLRYSSLPPGQHCWVFEESGTAALASINRSHRQRRFVFAFSGFRRRGKDRSAGREDGWTHSGCR